MMLYRRRCGVVDVVPTSERHDYDVVCSLGLMCLSMIIALFCHLHFFLFLELYFVIASPVFTKTLVIVMIFCKIIIFFILKRSNNYTVIMPFKAPSGTL